MEGEGVENLRSEWWQLPWKQSQQKGNEWLNSARERGIKLENREAGAEEKWEERNTCEEAGSRVVKIEEFNIWILLVTAWVK